MTVIEFPDLDTSYWKLKDKQWINDRKSAWPKIETMLEGFKSRKGLSIIKAYYLRGKMPDWHSLSEWMDERRHVDLMVFLWLHPSWDETVLRELRAAYVNSEFITSLDAEKGLGMFLYTQGIGPATPMRGNKGIYWPYLEGHGEMLFNVMFGDLTQNKIILNAQGPVGYPRSILTPRHDLHLVFTMAKWLVLNELHQPVQRDFLYQYEDPLEWWYQLVKDSDYFNASKSKRSDVPLIEQSLYQIHKFDIEKEGDSCRSRFVMRVRKIFNERPFFDDFLALWQRVKAGEVEVDESYFPYR